MNDKPVSNQDQLAHACHETGYERGWRDALEMAAKVVDVGAERPRDWDWRHLPAVIRSLTPRKTEPGSCRACAAQHAKEGM